MKRLSCKLAIYVNKKRKNICKNTYIQSYITARVSALRRIYKVSLDNDNNFIHLLFIFIGVHEIAKFCSSVQDFAVLASLLTDIYFSGVRETASLSSDLKSLSAPLPLTNSSLLILISS